MPLILKIRVVHPCHSVLCSSVPGWAHPKLQNQFVDLVHIRIQPLSGKLVYVYLFTKPLNKMIITQSLWHNIIGNRCMNIGLNQQPLDTNVHHNVFYTTRIFKESASSYSLYISRGQILSPCLAISMLPTTLCTEKATNCYHK